MTRPDLNPGVNVGTGELGHSTRPDPSGRPSQAALDDAQAEARRDASPASYQAPEKVNKRDSLSGPLLIGGAVVVIILALWFLLR